MLSLDFQDCNLVFHQFYEEMRITSQGASIHKGCDLFYLYDFKKFNYVSALLLGNSHNEIEDYCGARHI